MAEQTVVHSTFVIERNFQRSPEEVFAAFADPAKKRKWFAEGEQNEIVEFSMDFREGGTELSRYKMGEGTPFPGVELKNSGEYLDIVRNQRIVASSAMELGGRRISASLTTVELIATAKGTDMIFTHQGAFFEGSGGPEMREAGWNYLFDKLAKELRRQ